MIAMGTTLDIQEWYEKEAKSKFCPYSVPYKLPIKQIWISWETNDWQWSGNGPITGLTSRLGHGQSSNGLAMDQLPAMVDHG